MEIIENNQEIAKIVSKEEAFWTEVKERTEKEIETLEKMIKFNQAILEMSLSKIKDQQ